MCYLTKYFIKLNFARLPSLDSYIQISIFDLKLAKFTLSSFSGSKIRLVTLDASIDLLKGMVLSSNGKEGKSFLADTHFAQLEGIKEESTLLLRNFYKVIFQEVFPTC